MKTVNIGELKAKLSAHIRLVRGGEEVLVCDRNVPVARIVPCDLQNRSDQERRLIARGIMRAPRKRRRAGLLSAPPPGNVSDDGMERIWQEERKNR